MSPSGRDRSSRVNGTTLMCLGRGAPLELGEQFDLVLAFRTHTPMTVEVTVTE